MKDGYGDRCSARFWLEPHERECSLSPGHAGEHGDSTSLALDMASDLYRMCGNARDPSQWLVDIDTVQWALARPGVLSLLRALQAANYDETGAEYLRRIVTGRGQDGERSEAPEGRRVRARQVSARTIKVTNSATEAVRFTASASFICCCEVAGVGMCPVHRKDLR